MDSSNKLLSFDNVTARYTENTFCDRNALEDITFSLMWEPGLVALTGPNGSGKTSILRVITGQLQPIYGRVTLKGRDITDDPCFKRRGLGCIFQRAIDGMCSSLTIEENMCMMLVDDSPSLLRPLLTSYRKKYVLERAQKILSDRGQCSNLSKNLKSVLQRYPMEFSGGETQQLCLLALLLQEPPPNLVLADEPTLNLDQINRQICIEMLVELSRVTMILLATHDKELIGYCNHILMLEQGRLVKESKIVRDRDPYNMGAQ